MQLNTSSLRYKSYDGAYPDARLSKIVKFMMLSNGAMLSEEINNGNSAPLSMFATDRTELDRWMKGFQYNLNPSPTTDSLAKQVYFPVENNYHMLVVTKSSSLIHALFLNNFEKSVNSKRTKLDKYKEQHHYNEETYQCPTNIGKVSTTLSQPQNISILNGKRGGRLHLFSCNPPTWQSQLKPPLYKKSLFNTFSHPSINVDIDYLRDYLLRFERIELSIKNPQRRKWIEKWVANIIDELLSYAATIQTLPPGWSNAENSKLKPEHQYFLDPYRDDEVFQNARKASGWQSVVCNDFSRWLNRRLVGKDKKFTPQPEHNRLWATLLEQPLREYNQMIEADSRFQDKESV